MANYKIYSPNPSHNCDYGLDFYNGVAFTTSDSDVAWSKAHGYYVDEVTDDELTTVDKLDIDTLQGILNDNSVTLPNTGITKRELALAVTAILGAEFAATSFTTGITVTYAKADEEHSGTPPTETATGLGKEITIKASTGLTAPSGKKFSHWVDGNGIKHYAGDKLKLGAEALTLTAVWVDSE